MEFYKVLTPEQRLELLKLFNQWWLSATIPSESLTARVVLIYKKGDSSQFTNYRPISLLNSTYKIYASIIKTRLQEGIDHLLTPS